MEHKKSHTDSATSDLFDSAGKYCMVTFLSSPLIVNCDLFEKLTYDVKFGHKQHFLFNSTLKQTYEITHAMTSCIFVKNTNLLPSTHRLHIRFALL